MALGEILKQKRLERGWTKENIAERTHMLVRSIEALETENFKRIPAPIYGRGFIKQYCRLLDIDPQPLIDEYMQTVDSTYMPARTVTRPAVNDLPSRPPEPIHTGAHRILPPQKDEQPIISTTHKLVEPAEATYTSVPKPEGARTSPTVHAPLRREPSPPPPVRQEIPLPNSANTSDFAGADAAPRLTPEQISRLTGDAPVADAPAADADTSGQEPHRDLFAPTPKRPHKDVRPSSPSYPRRDPNASIFGPQHPVEDPPSPQLTFLRDLFGSIRNSITGIFRPRVRRIRAGEAAPLMTRALILRSLSTLGILIALTLLVFAFRFVFRASTNAETEAPLSTPSTTSTPVDSSYHPRPVDTPPMPFFAK